MKFSINKGELQNALTTVMKGAVVRTSAPVLAGVYCRAEQDRLCLQTTDNILSIRYHVNALVEEEGQVVIPAKLWADIIKTLPDAAVHLETHEDSVSILCDTASFSLKTLPAKEFPGFPEVDPQQTLEIPFKSFASMIKKVSRIASHDESRAILTGILISYEDKTLRLVATDSYRLAVVEVDFEQGSDEPFEAVIPSNFLQDIASLPSSNDNISLSLTENQIVIKYQDTVFVNRRLEGNYPNYRQLIPQSYETKVEFPTSQLVSVVKRISLLSTSTSPLRFDVNLDSQTTQISTVSQDIGAAQEIIKSKVEGGDMVVAFNHQYVLDGLNVIETETVDFELQDSRKPGVFRSNTQERFLYLIMPVRLV